MERLIFECRVIRFRLSARGGVRRDGGNHGNRICKGRRNAAAAATAAPQTHRGKPDKGPSGTPSCISDLL